MIKYSAIKKMGLCLGFGVLGAFATLSQAQSNYADDYWLNWEESDVDSFPTFDIKKGIEIELDVHSQLRWHIAPETLVIGKDSVIRYVVFAVSSSGTVNAMYEGILCPKATYKIYARSLGKTSQNKFEWRPTNQKDWQDINALDANAHERVLAHIYMCENHATPSHESSIIKRLHAPYAPTNPMQK